MDFTDSTKVVYNRIQKLDPENVSKIIGYLLLQDHGEREMIRLAFSPDNLLCSLVNKAKSDLGLNNLSVTGLSPISSPQVNLTAVPDVPLHFSPSSGASSWPVSSPATLAAGGHAKLASDLQQVHNLQFCSPGYPQLVAKDFRLPSQMRFLTSDDQLGLGNSVNSEFSRNYFYSEPSLGPRTSRRSPSLPEFPVKVCHYFGKGFCKHGSNCRYFHGHSLPESISQLFNPNPNEFAPEELVVSPRSLERLELELTELLKSRGGVPVSIASLPMMYYEKYGRPLEAEGYQTESQRHGKAGYNLTKLLVQLKNTICLIYRPHGQHSVILVEDVPKYLEHAGERNGGYVSSANQIYLTFPAESTFTEQDVFSYFSKFGPVQDVRIPFQQKRMYGFVTLVFAETVKEIFATGNPHFICDARVLVKPYREKSRLIDRKYTDKIHHLMYSSPHFVHADAELHSLPRVHDNSRLLRKQLIEEPEKALETERRRLSEVQLGHKPTNFSHDYGYFSDELKLAEEQAEGGSGSAERSNNLLDVLNNGSTSDDKLRRISINYKDQDSGQGLKLPESPFAHTLGNRISAVT